MQMLVVVALTKLPHISQRKGAIPTAATETAQDLVPVAATGLGSIPRRPNSERAVLLRQGPKPSARRSQASCATSPARQKRGFPKTRSPV